MMGYGFGGIGWGFSMFLSMLLPLVLIIGLIYLVSRLWDYGKKNASVKKYEDDPLTIIKQRYARGEIDKDEYKQLKAELSEK
ncbi:putative membrane protein [Desulfohalotomaculum tongense]|uniref:SHOCT domain-containing protein n=1 Tax=Desulforadius tongensis TaxID=1216062 RepID=UPI001A9C9B75|nr:SHOCT domain-containing protein [Desulforadius tongensis]MBM7853929.1 putative membrane protein [Desulforadius tongensis]